MSSGPRSTSPCSTQVCQSGTDGVKLVGGIGWRVGVRAGLEEAVGYQPFLGVTGMSGDRADSV